MSSFANKVKSAVKKVTPVTLRQRVGEYLSQRWNAKQEGRPVEEIFSAIYSQRRWGANSGEDFCSGDGSRAPAVVLPYVNAVRTFLGSLPNPSVVDLGCGDFHVGEQLRPYCASYVACDVVPALVQRNKEKFAHAQVDFRCLDMIEGDLPQGDVVFLRQVLQHLNNAQISKIVPKLYQYKYLVLTEHLPATPNFPPNRDKPTGGGTRPLQGSGVVLTASPFFLRAKSESVLCSIYESIAQHPAIIQTKLYDLQTS